MGQISSAPVELIRVQRCGGAGWRGAAAEMQGWRADHEDAHFVADGGEDGTSLFGVLDGHGGRAAAREAAHDRLPAALRRATAAGGALDEAAVTAAFVETDAWLRTVPAVQRDQSGTTCVVAGLRRRPQEAGAGAPTWDAWVANAGDSRGLLFRPGAGGAETLVASEDHKPDRPDELARIARAGGFVSDADAARRPAAAPPAVARLDGNLAVSRGLGDFAYKADGRLAPGDQKVSCAPEFYGAELRAGDLLILACDGVFDVMSNEGLCRAVAAALDGGADVGDVCARVLGACLRDLHSKDNMTLLVVQVGVDGAAYGRAPDEIAGLELYARQTDEAVRRAYLGFLRYCADTGGLPPPARELLDADGAPPAPPIDAPADSSAPPPAAAGGAADAPATADRKKKKKSKKKAAAPDREA